MITAQVETIADGGLDELKPLLPIHYEELSLHKQHDFPLDPQYWIYQARELKGELMYVTLRESGRLVGYFVGFIAPGLHYQGCLTLIMDIFYVVPECRGNNGGMVLFKEVKREAIRRGVNLWFVGNKEHSRVHATALFETMGFEKAETTYQLWLGVH